MNCPKPIESKNLIAISRRLEAMALSLGMEIGRGRVNLMEALNSLVSIVSLWMQIETMVLARAYEVLNIEIIKRMRFDAGLRSEIRAAIGEVNIRRWWQKYKGTYEPIRRGFNGRTPVRVSQYIWAKYRLRPVPNFDEPARERRQSFEPYLSAPERPERRYAFSFYGWELDGYAEPTSSSSRGEERSDRETSRGEERSDQDKCPASGFKGPSLSPANALPDP